jgi:hypothetical protein
VPVLPAGTRFGAHDLLPLLDAAVTTTNLAAEEARRAASRLVVA